MHFNINLFNSIYSFIPTDKDFKPKPKTQRIDVPENHDGGIVQMVNIAEVINDHRIELNETFVLKGVLELSFGDGCFVDGTDCTSELRRVITIIDDETDRKYCTI